MVLELLEITVKEGDGDAFEAAFRERGVPLLRRAKGNVSARLMRGIEQPTQFRAFIEWETLEDHINGVLVQFDTRVPLAA